MMVKPTVNELLEKAENRYALVIATSKRARQLSTGAKPLTSKKEESMVTLAADEIAEGEVKIVEKTEEPQDDFNGEILENTTSVEEQVEPRENEKGE